MLFLLLVPCVSVRHSVCCVDPCVSLVGPGPRPTSILRRLTIPVFLPFGPFRDDSHVGDGTPTLPTPSPSRDLVLVVSLGSDSGVVAYRPGSLRTKRVLRDTGDRSRLLGRAVGRRRTPGPVSIKRRRKRGERERDRNTHVSNTYTILVCVGYNLMRLNVQ